ncbi:hypothetical protein BZB76_1916 [Actinomadura pelletieri DSM 43383]|uniref:Uncharacterized protein n=1 Tax=Actinomadura pelletieri DSM 43383 TaxID=1120940 RepID=A0A495QST1_9ACTN|nr:hypothetical protein [Actinomadura pelletieri]RKS76560.1 hypothetical protein BZB76_1916 [Actinomadura pelletieri DSM 43383]
MNESTGGQDMISPELVDVAWPWSVNSTPGAERDPSLSHTPEKMGAAIDSLRALLRFLERHGTKAEAAREAIPKLDEMPWGLMDSEFDELMPTMTDLTRSNFRRWVKEKFNPAWIGASWDEPPDEVVEAVGWIWTTGSVQIAMKAVSEWLVQEFRRDEENPALPKFLEMVAASVPKLGHHSLFIVGIMCRAGKEKALPYFDRLGRDERIPSDIRESVMDRYRLMAKK